MSNILRGCMTIAFSVWDNRIAPVFDVARRLHIVRSEAGRIAEETQATVANGSPTQKALGLVELGVSVLVCGAISRQLLTAISAYGICVIPFIAGELRDVIQAHLAGTVEEDCAMPGRRSPRRKVSPRQPQKPTPSRSTGKRQ